MKKRITCFFLAVVMVVLCLPTAVLPAAAAATGETAKSGKTVYIRFRLGDARGYGYTGSIVKEDAMAPGVTSIEYPSDDLLLSYGIRASDLLGWYVMGPDGSVIDASAYNGVYISEDITFYPYLKSSSMSFNATSNTPIIDSQNTTAVLALRGGWNAGTYRDGSFAPFNHAPDPGLVYESNTNPWGDGAAYYCSGGGGAAMVLSKNANRVLALSWTALAYGRVNVDLKDLTFTAAIDNPSSAHVYLAIAKNDEIVWPNAAAENTPVTTGFADAGWYKVEAGNAETLTRTTVAVNAALKDIEVAAGDTIRFYFGYGNVRTIDAAPKVSYTTVGALSEDIQYSLPYAYLPDGPLSSNEKPVENAAGDGVTYPGQWKMIMFSSRADIADRTKAVLLDTYTTVGIAKAVLSTVADHGEANICPALANLNLTTTNWGDQYSFALPSGNASVGFRYTAEHAGFVSPTFDQLKKSMVGWKQGAATYNDLRLAIFVDGVQVWPTAGGAANDTATWYQPYTVAADYELLAGQKPDATVADKTAAVNTALEDVSFYVQQGSQVDFLLTYVGSSVSIWGGAANNMVPAIRYTDLFETNLAASATLADTLALNFSADANTASFTPSTKRAYLLADTLALTLSCTADQVVVGTPAITNGKLRATVSHIVAKQMTEEVTYALTATAKHPSGETEELTLGRGSISIASYMKQFYQQASDDTTRDLILATLQYGAEAQQYFNYKTDRLANADLNGTPSFSLPAAVDKAEQSGSGDYWFSAASLLLEDTVQMKLFVDAQAEARGDWASLYLAVNGKKVEGAISPRAGSTDGRYLKTIFSVPFADYDTDYSITLHKADGTQVSTTLKYSVESYAARTADIEDQTTLVRAMRLLGSAAQEYKKMTTPTADGNIVTRLVFLSDAHVGETSTNAHGKLAAQLAKIKEWDESGKSVDAILFPGDMVNLGTNSEYETFNQIISNAGLANDIQLSFSIGNHEFSTGTDGTKGSYTDNPSAEAIQWTFAAFNNYIVNNYHTATNYTKSEDGLDHVLRLSNGVHIIALSMRGGGTTYGTATETFLRQAIQNAVAEDPDKPILIYNHIGYGEIKGSATMQLSDEMKAFVNNYPQIIWFTGHTHYALQDPYMIQQKNFTNIQLPTAGSKWWWYYYAGYTSPASYAFEANQGLVLTISDTDVVYAERYDFGTNETIGQKWRIDIPAILRSKDNFTYTTAERVKQAEAPTFAADAALTVSDITAKTATVSTPLATIDDSVSDNVVEYYKIIVTDTDDNIVFRQKLLSEYYRAGRQNPNMTFSVTGLRPATTYRVYVRADSIFQKSSASLYTTFTTQESLDPKEYLTELVNIDYRDGIADDRNGHTFATVTDGSTGAGPVLKNGTAVFDGKSAYRYTLNAADKALMTDTLTIEATLQVDKASDHATLNNGYGSLISNMEHGGFCLKYRYENGVSRLVLEVRSSAAEACVTAEADITLKEEMHIVATVGDGYITLYVDGKQVAQTAFNGTIVHNASSAPHALLVGGDPDGSGALQAPSYCTVKEVHLYAENVTADDAAKMYRNACADATIGALTQILDIDYATGSASDSLGHSHITSGTPTITDGEAVFAGNGAYRYALTDDDYKKIASSVTIETMVTITENNKADWHGIVSSMNAGGFGLLFYDTNYAGAGETGKGKLKFEYNVKGIGYKSVFSDTITMGDKLHVVVSYDGYVATMYINGQLLGSCVTKADLNLHSDKCMVVGADHNGGTNIERKAYCKISYVNMYAEGVNYDQVQQMYQNAQNRA